MRRIIVGISGASGAGLGLKFLRSLPDALEKYCVISKGAREVLKLEEERVEFDFGELRNLKLLEDEDLGACIASGSFICEAMAVIPCSCDSLAKIACGISDTLLLRAANVMIKENRKLLLGVREMPFSVIALENMLKLSRLGVVIAPPIFGYYAGRSIEEVETLLVGKWCDSLGIAYDYKRWR
ncbi:UbiX family flavin prenyltransferase [Helicobacter turcicus]|uniref:UbiX family flavin prenyltransferase n=1 Tax=Helicobacter turcicus TaxID=2867412 RepID=A0ABS7JMD2_9HELI|nr:UbiX family flavin prenyltransferase [Helicobacter turcicus]MBX7490538.1 UbiX family flavin prenyltransferase [Helicobacter turcicus]MBX7545397.1 UbiX family flavin prenyltransferase [Helicobacter turcicus]